MHRTLVLPIAMCTSLAGAYCIEVVIENIDVDYDIRSGIVSEEELEKETGAGPRGDRSRYIETDTGTVQSKYRFRKHYNILIS